ncbi:photosynthetic NDH subunit of lumenal location 3, chloroplastic isoform X2 [Oryza brachyantha]|uniref:photosynthetic NDH subunit of lumenal location 3, chloroplastic isoform X2 n=1 Tax=Oryza brachyantha TaxID=4533 RepID=UPI001ADC2FD3|nr:photosynthetic NDH subunit of lumenal location 3, chloroplastic isoform X2 [Oryza brachyantha]
MATTYPGLTAAASPLRPSPRRRLLLVVCQCNCNASAGRRSACVSLGLGLGLAATLVQQQQNAALAADEEPANNGWWLTEFPLPVKKIVNKWMAEELNNAETGSRTFVRNGIYIADIGESYAAHAYRLRSTAFDLLALEDLLGNHADRANYVTKYLRLKSTFMYYDFDSLLSAAAADLRPPLLDLATRLFDSFETLQRATATKDDAQIAASYAHTKTILHEVMAKMA